MGRLGGGSGVCEYIACPLGFLLVSLERLWFPLAGLWAPFGSLWGPFGSLWGPFGSLWGPFGSFWGPFGYLWGPWGAPWAAKGHILGFVKRWASNSGPMALISAACRQKLTSRHSSPDPPDPGNPPDPGEMRLGRQLATPLPRAGG